MGQPTILSMELIEELKLSLLTTTNYEVVWVILEMQALAIVEDFSSPYFGKHRCYPWYAVVGNFGYYGG